MIWLLLFKMAFADASFRIYAKPGVNVNGRCVSTAVLKGDAIIATVALDTCQTGNDARDEHMREDLNTKEHPVALLKGVLGVESFAGDLTIRGVTKKVSGKRNGKSLSFKTKLSEFGVPRRQKVFGLVAVQDDVEIVGTF